MKFAWWDLRFVLALFVLAITVTAGDTDFDADLNNGAFAKRQSVAGTGNTSPTTTTQGSTDTETTTISNAKGTTTTLQTTETSTTPLTTPPSSSTLISTTTSSAAASSSSSESTTPSQSDTSKTTFTSTLMGSSTSRTTFVALTTSSDGQVLSSTITSYSVVSSPTGYATYTSSHGLASGDFSGGSSGLSIDSKKIIGGLVGGVGGAILLGGIILVCWRIWGRKRSSGEDDDYGSAGSLNREKEPSGQLTADTEDPLQRYQAPGRPNAAANF